MSKILIDEAVVRQALKKLEELRETVDCEWGSGRDLTEIDADGEQWDEVIALRQALAEAALDKMADNARELGLDYVQCEPQPAVTEDGYCEWVCPEPKGYLMQCCDCGLIHEVDFRVAKYKPRPSEEFVVVDDPDLQAQLRMRRRDDISPNRPAQEPDPDELTIAYMSGVYEGKKRKPWVGLTDEERRACTQSPFTADNYLAIEAKLEEKNT